ncbi:MAG: type II methionyl aminopeptidase [Thermoprotei archaeon]|nr:MAG: type II methionyl aminopeptidase [Thermoprotei archaeon]
MSRGIMQIPEDLRKAGHINNEALKLALSIVEEGVELLDIAERIENFIISRGGFPAFPVNISINEVAAHYSPCINDNKKIPPGSVVKIDVGVHVNGYISDAAITIFFNRKWKNLVYSAWSALKAAISIAHDGLPLSDIGKAVSREITSRGFRPIENLTGHKIERYNLHAGKSVPNVPSIEFRFLRMKTGEIYAIEPFSTNGIGYVNSGGSSHIYRVVSTRRLKKSKELSHILLELWNTYKGLPFSERWVIGKIIDKKETLELLVREKRVHHYSMLIEDKRGFVAQFEDTIVVGESDSIPLVNTLEIIEF